MNARYLVFAAALGASWIATAFACWASLYSGSSKPMVNVFTGRVLWTCISATTREESMPPERNAPRGTSAIISRRMVCLSSRSRS